MKGIRYFIYVSFDFKRLQHNLYHEALMGVIAPVVLIPFPED